MLSPESRFSLVAIFQLPSIRIRSRVFFGPAEALGKVQSEALPVTLSDELAGVRRARFCITLHRRRTVAVVPASTKRTLPGNVARAKREAVKRERRISRLSKTPSLARLSKTSARSRSSYDLSPIDLSTRVPLKCVARDTCVTD